MKFVGDINSSFNKKLLPLLNEIPYTVISYIDENYSYVSEDDSIIQLLPISESSYFKSVDIAYTQMIKNGFYDTLKTCTSIFIVEPNLIEIEKIGKIINEFDKNNLLDNIWIYPTPVTNYKLRSNEVSHLPFQNQTK